MLTQGISHKLPAKPHKVRCQILWCR